MAKSKSKKLVLEEEVLEETEDAQEEEVQEDDVEEESAGDQAESHDEESASPRHLKPQMTKTAMAFILLNWIMVPAFLYFAYLDHMARVQYSYRTLLNYISAWGLPLRSEEDFQSASNQARPQMVLTPGQLTEAFRSRKGTKAVPATEPFVTVDEPVPLRLRPSDLTEAVMRDVFWDLTNPVPTLEDEIERLKKDVPDQIEKAAREVREKQKTDDDKRDAARKTLLPLAWDVKQVKKLEDRIAAAKGPELDTLVEEGVQRRIYYDILAPINVFRPGDLTRFTIEKIADLDAFKLDDIKAYLVKRFDAAIAENYNAEHHIGNVWNEEKSKTEAASAMKRDSIEIRQKIAFILFTLSQIEVKLLENKKLYPKGIERAQTVCGIREFTSASIYYVQALRILEERIVQLIEADRQGHQTTLTDELKKLMKIDDKDFQRVRLNGFIDKYESEVDRLVKVVEYIDFAQKRIDDLKTQRDHLQKVFDQRDKHHKETLVKMLAARKTTEKYVKELRQKQDELHEALKVLSDAAEHNFELEARIRKIEVGYLNRARSKKGGN